MAQIVYVVMADKPTIGNFEPKKVPCIAFRDKESAEEQAKRMGYVSYWDHVQAVPYIEELVDFGAGDAK